MNEEGREGRPPQQAQAWSTELELGSHANSNKMIIFGVLERTENSVESKDVQTGGCWNLNRSSLSQFSSIFYTENVMLHLEKIKLNRKCSDFSDLVIQFSQLFCTSWRRSFVSCQCIWDKYGFDPSQRNCLSCSPDGMDMTFWWNLHVIFWKWNLPVALIIIQRNKRLRSVFTETMCLCSSHVDSHLNQITGQICESNI